MISLDEAIKHAEEVAEECEFKSNPNRNYPCFDSEEKRIKCQKCGEEHRQLAEWLKELKQLREQNQRKGEWRRMSDLSEQEDDRYQCSRCKNVVHYKDKMNLYTFNSWCGRCGSDNDRHINYGVE